jgi:hypothetical protein
LLPPIPALLEPPLPVPALGVSFGSSPSSDEHATSKLTPPRNPYKPYQVDTFVNGNLREN